MDNHIFFPIKAFDDNYIWSIVNQHNGFVTIVDPGDAKPVKQYLNENNLQLEAILITHHHADHIGGVEELVDDFNPIIFAPTDLNFSDNTQHVTEESSITLEKTNLKLEVLEVPGHTLDHIAYYTDGVLFCGDTLFFAGCGRVFEGTPEQMYNSLQKLINLPSGTKIYCAHEYTLSNLNFAQAVEPDNNAIKQQLIDVKKMRELEEPSLPSSLAVEKEVNPFLRVDRPTVKMAAEKYAGHVLDSGSDIFAAIREWKNNF